MAAATDDHCLQPRKVEVRMRPIEAFRQKLSSGQVCIGVSITMNDPLIADALGDSADFFWIDLEHSNMSPEALNGHLLAARSRGVASLVRVTGNTTPFIKPVLDVGADGIIAPRVSSVAEVEDIVRDCRYPPVGRRGYGPRVPSNYGRDGGADFIERANENVFVAAQIETAEAMDVIAEIAAVPGLDSLAIGPMDLSGALGTLGDTEDPKVVAAIETIVSAARAAGLYVGVGLGADAERACTMADRGLQWIHVGCDFHYLVKCADDIRRDVFRGLGRTADSGGAAR